MAIREKLNIIVFGTDTKAGKRFDVFLLWLILISVLAVMLESIPDLSISYGKAFYYIEWVLTLLFTAEYLLRIWISKKPLKYIFSFWGVIDLLAILPTYLTLVLAGYHYLLIVRVFRLLRVFRILKLVRFNNEAQALIHSLRSSLYKIGVFFVAVIAIVTFMGTIMYVVESGEQGFTSIPQSIYWAIVTVTTVGYGDMVPHTVLGKIISSFVMIIGYAIIAVPTGIVTVGMVSQKKKTQNCPNCDHKNPEEANYCANCGEVLKV